MATAIGNSAPMPVMSSTASDNENVRWRVRKQFEKGIPNGRFRLYGYRWEDDRLMIVPEEAAIIRRIFQNFLDGKTQMETAREFAAEGIRTRNGCRWENSNLKRILTNVIYTGNMLLQREYTTDPITKHRKQNHGERMQYYVENTHEAIIDKEMFDHVQQELIQRREMERAARKSCFSGKIKCGICGKNFVRQTRRVRGFSEVWICTSRKKGNCKCSMKGSIPVKVLKRECAMVLGLNKFDETVFLDRIDRILVPEHHVMIFYLKNGQVITRHWISTAIRDRMKALRKERGTN